MERSRIVLDVKGFLKQQCRCKTFEWNVVYNVCILHIAVDVVLLCVSVPIPAKHHSLQWEANEERRWVSHISNAPVRKHLWRAFSSPLQAIDDGPYNQLHSSVQCEKKNPGRKELMMRQRHFLDLVKRSTQSANVGSHDHCETKT